MQLTTARLSSSVRHHRRVMREEAAEQLKQRYLRMRWDDGAAVLCVSGRLVGAEGAAVKDAIDHIATHAPPNPGDGSFEPYEWRCADALVELATGGTGEAAGRAAVVVHVDVGQLNAINGKAILHDGPSIVAETARRLACDGRVQLSVDGPDGQTLRLGRTRRTVSPSAARELMRRDQGCRFADCGRTRGVQMHHIHHRAHGGATDADNLVTLCPSTTTAWSTKADGGWSRTRSSDCASCARTDVR